MSLTTIAPGFQETRRYLPDSTITSFLNRAIRNRITLRLLAEQHLSLSAASLPSLRQTSPTAAQPSAPRDPRIEPSARPPSSSLAPTRVGILDLSLSPRDLIDTCAGYVSELCEATYGVAPKYRIEGNGATAVVGGIGVHLEYVMTELRCVPSPLRLRPAQSADSRWVGPVKNAFRATVECHTPKQDRKSVV